MKRIQIAILALFLVGGSTVGAAFAQGNSKRPAKPKAPLSSSEQAAAAQAVVDQGTQLSQRVGHMLDDARREADIIRLTCLNDKLTEINAVLRSAQGRVGSLGKAANSDSRSHEFTVLTVLGQKLQTLDQEANQCVGQDLYETGTTKVVTEIDPALLPFEKSPGTPPAMLPYGGPGAGQLPPSAGPMSGKN